MKESTSSKTHSVKDLLFHIFVHYFTTLFEFGILWLVLSSLLKGLDITNLNIWKSAIFSTSLVVALMQSSKTLLIPKFHFLLRVFISSIVINAFVVVKFSGFFSTTILVILILSNILVVFLGVKYIPKEDPEDPKELLALASILNPFLFLPIFLIIWIIILLTLKYL